MEGCRVGSSGIVFKAGSAIGGGQFKWDIGTAGSTTMLALAILPVACFASRPVSCHIYGGLFQDFAPSAYHMQHALLPTLRRMGLRARLKVVRPGYVPKGGGIIQLEVRPVEDRLASLEMTKQGRIVAIEGIALSSHLRQRKVSERMAIECQRVLGAAGLTAIVDTNYDATASQAGAALALFARTDSEAILGADRAGTPGRTSEEIGRHVARSLIEDLATSATVDRFLADQLIVFAALAHGTSEFVIPRSTDHIRTNLWMVEKILGAKAILKGQTLRIHGVGYERRHWL